MPEEGEGIKPENGVPAETSEERIERRVKKWGEMMGNNKKRKKEPAEA